MLVGSFMAVMAMLLLGIAGMWWKASEAEAARRDAEALKLNAETEAASTAAINAIFTDLVIAVAPDEGDTGRLKLVDQVLKEAEARTEREWAEKPLVEAAVREVIAKTYAQSLGQYRDAIPHSERALELRRAHLGAQHPDTIAALDHLANLYWHQRLLDKAETLYLEILATRQRLHGDEHEDTLSTMGGLAAVYNYQERYDEAQELLLRVLQLGRPLIGHDHPLLFKTMGDLAYAYTNVGQLDEAERVYLDLLELKQGDPPDIAFLNNLAEVYQRQGRLQESEARYLEALSCAREGLGDEHSLTIGLIGNLGRLYYLQRRYDEAEPLLLEAAERRRRNDGEMHPSTIGSIAQLAHLLWSQQRYADAEPLYREVLELQRASLGPENPQTLTTMSRDLAVVLMGLGRDDEAERLLKDALEAQQRTLVEDHPDTFETMMSLGALYRGQGRLQRASSVFEEALAGHEDDPRVAEALVRLAVELRRSGDLDQAVRWLRRSMEISRAYDPGDQPAFREGALRQLAHVLHDQGRLEEAESTYRERLNEYRKLVQDEHPAIQEAKRELAMCVSDQGRQEEAEVLLRELLRTQQREFAEDDPRITETLGDLGWVLVELGRLDEAESVLRECIGRLQHHPTAFAATLACATSALGATLAAQQRFEEAEPLLLQGYDDLRTDLDVVATRKRTALQHLVDLYDDWGKPEQAAEWRAKLPAS
ncbi:MAG: tetratricopeptide repeat protein [Planctomycetota bacterium]|jgi:tetratricopeptide (TPR) repeat protein